MPTALPDSLQRPSSQLSLQPAPGISCFYFCLGEALPRGLPVLLQGGFASPDHLLEAGGHVESWSHALHCEKEEAGQP